MLDITKQGPGGGRSADGEGKCLLELGDVGLLMLMVGWLGL